MSDIRNKMSTFEWWTRWLDRKCGTGMILIFKEKHGNRYFMADTPARASEAFRSVLTDRYGPKGQWGPANQIKQEIQEQLKKLVIPEIPEDEIDKIFYNGIRNKAYEDWIKFRKKQKELKVQIGLWDLVTKAVKKCANTMLSVEAASYMQDYEYCDFYWEKLE